MTVSKLKHQLEFIFICKVALAKKQETLRTWESKQPFAHLSTTHGGGFTLTLLKLNVKQDAVNTSFIVSGMNRPGIEPEPTLSEANGLNT